MAIKTGKLLIGLVVGVWVFNYCFTITHNVSKKTNKSIENNQLIKREMSGAYYSIQTNIGFIRESYSVAPNSVIREDSNAKLRYIIFNRHKIGVLEIVLYKNQSSDWKIVEADLRFVNKTAELDLP
jgi:hypothetical protein